MNIFVITNTLNFTYMKNLTSLFIIGFVIFMCIFAYNTNEKNEQMKRELEQRELEMYSMKNDSVQIIQDSLQNVQEELSLGQAYRDSIQIINVTTDKPNTSGGVNLYIKWKNNTRRVIKYVRFKVSAMNGVNDEVYCEMSMNTSPMCVKITGPINPNQISGNDTYWDNVWYNGDIRRCVIRKMEVDFMDGSTVVIPMG